MAGKHAAPPPKYTIQPATAAQAQATASQRPEVLQVVSGAGTPQERRVNLPPFSQLGKDPNSFARSFLASSGSIPLAWGISMVLVGIDEWRTHGVLARPARLWWSSIFYFILAVIAHFDRLRPIANVIAWGFVVTLLYQFFTKSGQFTKSGETFNAQGQQTG